MTASSYFATHNKHLITKGGTGGGEWVHPMGAKNMAVPGFGREKPLV